MKDTALLLVMIKMMTMMMMVMMMAGSREIVFVCAKAFLHIMPNGRRRRRWSASSYTMKARVEQKVGDETGGTHYD